MKDIEMADHAQEQLPWAKMPEQVRLEITRLILLLEEKTGHDNDRFLNETGLDLDLPERLRARCGPIDWDGLSKLAAAAGMTPELTFRRSDGQAGLRAKEDDLKEAIYEIANAFGDIDGDDADTIRAALGWRIRSACRVAEFGEAFEAAFVGDSE